MLAIFDKDRERTFGLSSVQQKFTIIILSLYSSLIKYKR